MNRLSISLLKSRRPMAPALPIRKRRSRKVAVLWAIPQARCAPETLMGVPEPDSNSARCLVRADLR
jgi:hypothetical protein